MHLAEREKTVQKKEGARIGGVHGEGGGRLKNIQKEV